MFSPSSRINGWLYFMSGSGYHLNHCCQYKSWAGITTLQTRFSINEIQIWRGMHGMAGGEELQRDGQWTRRGVGGQLSSTHYQSVNIYSSTSLLPNHHILDHVWIRKEWRKWKINWCQCSVTIHYSLEPTHSGVVAETQWTQQDSHAYKPILPQLHLM